MFLPNAISVLLVEDNPADALLIREQLIQGNTSLFYPDHVERLDLALERVERHDYQAVLLDLNLPDSVGLDTLVRLRSRVPSLPIVVLTGQSDVATALRAVQAGAQDYLIKGELDPGNFLARVVRFAIERHRVQRELEESRAGFRNIVDNNSDAILVVDARGVVCFSNPAVAVLFDGRSVQPGDPFGFPVVAGEITELDIVPLGPRRRVAEMHVSLTEWNGATAFLASLRDITARKRMEEELWRARKEAELANQAKSAFLAVMSHEIRTPLSTIIGLADLLTETPLNAEQHEFVTWLKESSETLFGLINDILDLSKVEAGEMELDNQPFSMHDLTRSTLSIVGARANQKHLTLLGHVDSSLPPLLLGDAGRLRQILLNLLGNAIKFTDLGCVTLRVDGRGEQPGGFGVRFSVTDTGIGIPLEKQEMVFDDFIQADASIANRFGGTGLGLGISKRLAQLMGGRIGLSSREGEGSTFYVDLTLPLPSHPPLPAPDQIGSQGAAPLAGRRVLLIEVHPMERMGLIKLLSGEGVLVEEATDWREGLLTLHKAAERSAPIHLLILGRERNNRTPREMLEEWRADVCYRGQPVLWFDETLTEATTLDENNGLALPRPCQPEEVLRRVVALLARERPLRILLADDALEMRKIIHSFLKRSHHHLEMAENGREALIRFREGRFDLVLMDLEMPVMDGLAAVRAIRALEREGQSRRTPILAFSATVFKEEEEAALDAGCDGLLAKPIRKGSFLEVIRKYGQ